MKTSRFVIILAGVIIAVSAITAAVSSPPSPPPTGSAYPLAYNSANPVSLAANADGALMADEAVGTLFPTPGATPIQPAINTCVHVSTISPRELVAITFVDANQLGSGNSLDVFDETAATCADIDRVYATGNAGAGAVITVNLPLQNGLTYKLTAGSNPFLTGYGIRFRVVP